MPEDAALLKEEFYRDSMKFKVQYMAKDLQILKAEERGDTAELTITGTGTGHQGPYGKGRAQEGERQMARRERVVG